MPRTLRAAQQIVPAGIVPSYSAVDNANGEYIQNSGNEVLHVKNGSGGSINVTIVSNVIQNGLTLPNLIVAVGAGAEKFIGPFQPSTFSQSDGTVNLNYSAGASVTAALFRH
jgi:hypothetical protein